MSEPDSLIGREIAHFRITGKLGEGGMGAVYRAEDTRLGREVALKVLPDELSGDAERLTRLRREAKLLASLNHSNIASIHGLEELDGRLALELELVEGEDLALRIAGGPLAIDEVVDLAAQIASGLDEAHDRGVIHRDLKPANIKITPDGVAKVLDFGLAKPDDDGLSSSDVSRLDTVTRLDVTREGVIMGTAAYMSPEQARGRKVDRRTDVWAFGCVLYEMLTGRRAFGGETMTDVLVAVVSGEPDWGLVPGSTPRPVRRLLRRCLQRDPRHRLRSLGDAVLELQDTGADDPEPPLEAGQHHGVLGIWAAVGPLLGIFVGAGLWWALADVPTSPQRPVRRLATIADPVKVYATDAPSLAVSPDAARLVYAATDPPQLVGRLRDQLSSAPIPGTEGAVAPFFSPDGRSIGFVSDGELRTMPISGGDAVTLCETGRFFFGAVWAPDGFVYFSRPWVAGDGDTTIALLRVAAGGGPIEPVSIAEPENGRLVALTWPSLLPDGRTLLVTRWAGGGTSLAIEAVSIADGSRQAVLEDHQQAVFLPSGFLVAGNPDGHVVALPFDPERLQVTGSAVPIAAGVHRSRYGALQFAADSEGAIVSVPTVGHTRQDELVWVDRDGNETPASTHLRHYESPKLGRDGLVVLAIRSSNDDINIWMLDTVRDTLQPVTTDTGYLHAPIHTSSGVVYSAALGSDRLAAGIYLAPSEAAGEPRPVVPGLLNIPSSVSRDGSRLLFYRITPSADWDVWVTDLGSNGGPEPLITAPFDQLEARFAPNGEWIAYQADVSGRTEVFIRRLDEGGFEDQISPHGGEWPVWSADGDEIFFIGRKSMMSVAVDLGDPPSIAPARAMFDVDPYSPTFDLSADGRRFLMIRRGAEPAGTQINVVLDWPSGAAETSGGQN
jgi:serine/threonine-protein kinase